MPDPRSLRFGFGLGIGLLGALVAWLVWPAGPKSLLVQDQPAQIGAMEGGPTAAAPPLAGLLPPDASRQSGLDAARPAVSPGPAPPPTLPLTFDSAPTGRIQLVERATGLPLPYFDVNATRGGAGHAWVETDENGWFELDDSAITGAWTLKPPREENRSRKIEPQLVWADPHRTTRVYLEEAALGLHLTVENESHQAVAGATIDLIRRENGETVRFLRKQSDPRGSLHLPWPPRGTVKEGWHAIARHPEVGTSELIALGSDPEKQAIPLQLHSGSSFRLSVTDYANSPYPGLEVRLRSLTLARNAFVQQLPAQPHYLNDAGSRTWDHLAPGEYKLSLRSPQGVGWLDRTITIRDSVELLDWVIDRKPATIALAGRLIGDQGEGAFSSQPKNHYIQLQDAATGQLIAGTRTDGAGRFQLFGEANGVVILRTDLLESEWMFPPHEHRFLAGDQEVLLQGMLVNAQRVDFRVLDAHSQEPIPQATLIRRDSEFEVWIGASNAVGVLRAEVREDWSYELRASGYIPLALPLKQTDWGATLRLKPGI